MDKDEILQAIGRVEGQLNGIQATLNQHSISIQDLNNHRKWVLGVSSSIAAGVAFVTQYFTR